MSFRPRCAGPGTSAVRGTWQEWRKERERAEENSPCLSPLPLCGNTAGFPSERFRTVQHNNPSDPSPPDDFKIFFRWREGLRRVLVILGLECGSMGAHAVVATVCAGSGNLPD